MSQDDDPIRSAAWRAITETATHFEVALAIKHRYGWACSDRSAVARLSQMLSPRDSHQLPADVLLDIVAITRRDEFTGLLMRARVEAEMQAERGMARVAPAAQRDRRRA